MEVSEMLDLYQFVNDSHGRLGICRLGGIARVIIQEWVCLNV